jgi:Glycosyl hydrolase family 26
MRSMIRFHIVFPVFILSLSVNAQQNLPSDHQATPETINLYRHLKSLNGFMMGHQDDLAYGVGWKYIPGKSDIREVAGDYPAIYGWELGRIEIDQPVNLDSVPFDKMRGFIREAYDRGGVITISWHLNNPLTGKSAWDPSPGTVGSVLPTGDKHALYLSWLDKIAAFMLSLKGAHGELIPVIFRPFHEINGNWFWWGGKNASPEEIKQLYQLTETYLRDKKNVHNLLYAYNTDRFSTKEEWLLRYPGDDWVDIGGFDIYQGNTIAKNEAFIAELDKTLALLESICQGRNKVPALTEFGYNGIPDSAWWSNVLNKGIGTHRIAYALAWRNAGKKNATQFEYYVPYPGQVSAQDFRKFFALDNTLFQKDVTALKLYQ